MRLLNTATATCSTRQKHVSILVLVDAPLEYDPVPGLQPGRSVSILVLVDAPLEYYSEIRRHRKERVSILVLVDAPLEFRARYMMSVHFLCFNPCFSGCASWIKVSALPPDPLVCFNPCFSGCASWILHKFQLQMIKKGFNPCFSGCASWIWQSTALAGLLLLVSILVLVDAPLESL